MDRTKLVMLSFLTALLAQKGVVSERLLQKVLGLWAFALQFRRPLFSLLQAAYHVGHPEGCPVSPFRMPRTLQVELWMLSVLGPLSITNLKAQVSSFVYATDASPDGAGIVCANVGQEVASELFRRADNRGFHTRLLSPPGAALQECGIEPEEPLDWPAQASEPCSSTNLTHWVLLPPPSDDGDFATELGIAESQELWQRFLSACLASRAFTVSAFQLDFLEVYAGAARLSQAFLAQGFRVGPPIELKLGWDLDNELFGFLLRLCRAKKVGLLWLGPPCKTFSLARCPKGRTRYAPWGIDPLDWDTAEGNLHLHQSLALFLAQCSVGLEAIVETPYGAYSRNCLGGGLLHQRVASLGSTNAAMVPPT